ncbi:MAG: 2-dehydropantoate 2-reductase [Oleiphilaceae bacterium]|jgi:2-dehydropantoate 2-reductase
MASIYILGAGAMGSLWATHLHLAFKDPSQHCVQFLSTRNNAPKQISFSLNSPFLLAHESSSHSNFDIDIPLNKTSELNTTTQENPNIILLCTKSYHALDAALMLKPYLNEHCYLVLFQNGLGSQHKILEVCHNTPIFAAVSTEGVNRQADGKLVHAGKGLTRIGPLNDKAKETTSFERCLTALTHQGLATEATENIWQALWEKLAINCAINPFTAILNCPNGAIKNSALFQENWPLLKVELTEILNSAGIKITRAELEERVFKVIENTRNNISSMLQDVRANRKTEIDDINGYASEYLLKRNLNNDVNKMLHESLLLNNLGQTKLNL